MEETNIFETEYVEPKQEQKDALIAQLIAGDFKLSFSALHAFSVSPREFIRYKLQERVTTPAMLLGKAVHCLVLEPDEFDKRFFVMPDVSASTKEGKAEWAKIYSKFVGEIPADAKFTKGEIIEAVKEAVGVQVLDAKTAKSAEMRARQLRNNRASAHILNQLEVTETKVECVIDGISFRGIIDGYSEHANIIADVKIMPNATWDKAAGAIWGRKLHWQAHIYDKAKGYGHRCYILAVDPMGEVSVHGFSENHLLAAGRQITSYLNRFKECIFLSQTTPGIWDSSQEFWLQSDFNEYGINYF
jgi:hypothetical protein